MSVVLNLVVQVSHLYLMYPYSSTSTTHIPPLAVHPTHLSTGIHTSSVTDDTVLSQGSSSPVCLLSFLTDLYCISSGYIRRKPRSSFPHRYDSKGYVYLCFPQYLPLIVPIKSIASRPVITPEELAESILATPNPPGAKWYLVASGKEPGVYSSL